jgi:DNA-directed RNA polymerase subunit RPC12/RpoP
VSNVVEIDEYRPHVTGIARCEECSQEWVAVILLASADKPLECPNCGQMQGRLR